MWENDVHSKLNLTRVGDVMRPASVGELVAMVARAAARGRPFAIAGRRHAMGGQQFGTDADLIDMTALNQITTLDRQRGILEVGAGAAWPDVVEYCRRAQEGDAK